MACDARSLALICGCCRDVAQFERIGLKRKKVEILCVGLDNSGKSTLLQCLTEKAVSEVVPTVGFAVERFRRGKLAFSAFDMSGQGRAREMWPSFYGVCSAIVFVIDCSDRDRMCVVLDEISALLAHEDIASRTDVPVLVFGNKADVEGALTRAELTTVLPLATLMGDRDWAVHPCCALTGEGVGDGMDWLASLL